MKFPSQAVLHNIFDEGVYYCSEFVADLLGIEGNKISAKDFANLICENYRERILEEFRSFRMMEIYEQVFPIHSKYGMMWVSTKVGEKRITKEGHVRIMGMLQCISRQRMNMQEQTVDRLNSLLSRLNGISKSLLDFLHSDDITLVINKILKEVLRQFQADRTYILEFDRKLHTEVCTYEIAVEGIKERKVLLSESSIDYASWWTGQILAGNPIILFTLNLLPDSAGADKRRLEEYGVKSTMVVPLNSKDGVWGYIGVFGGGGGNAFISVDASKFPIGAGLNMGGVIVDLGLVAGGLFFQICRDPSVSRDLPFEQWVTGGSVVAWFFGSGYSGNAAR